MKKGKKFSGDMLKCGKENRCLNWMKDGWKVGKEEAEEEEWTIGK
jgi:hypothetical protein